MKQLPFLMGGVLLLAVGFQGLSQLRLASISPATALPMIASPSKAEYQRLAQQANDNLQQQILKQWFPRALDVRGGWKQNFAENWAPLPETEKSVVYQARLTWLASQAAERFPQQKVQWNEFSRHGAAFLRDVMWDSEFGGFYWSLNRDGAPQRDGEKNAYGVAFSIYALSANYRTTGDERSLERAKQAFSWLETHSHDAAHGGYYEALTRQGVPILAPLPNGQNADPVGTRFGRKSMNSHIHLLEAFASLSEIWPDATLKKRLNEVFLLVRDTVVETPPGAMSLYFTPEWKPVPDHDSYGHDIETAYLLVEAAGALGKPDDERTWQVARALVDHTLLVGLDPKNGGIYDSGSTTGTISNPEKVWWVQAEALNAMLLMHEKYGAQTPRYWNAYLQQWDWIQNHQVDAKFGGWQATVTPEGAAIAGRVKSDGWTECYHQGRAMLNVSAMLEKLAQHSP